MALYITSIAKDSKAQWKQDRWMIQSGDNLDFILYDGEVELTLEASGDDLQDIISKFANLCYPHSKGIVTWRGEMARFILDNL